jgi:hypothetical protein
MRKVLLNKRNSKTSVNEPMSILVDLNRDVSLFQEEILTEKVDVMQMYLDEKNKSTNHRFIFTVYPLCTNALFNNLTEIVYKEGSSDARIILNNDNSNSRPIGAISKSNLNRIQCIRNTEYSNDSFDLKYHCGADIFNNHILRAKDNMAVQKRGSQEYALTGCTLYNGKTNEIIGKIDAFNTIGDYNRNNIGEDIGMRYPNKSKDYTYKNAIEGKQTLYTKDSIKGFINAYNEGIKRKDGWIGFLNPSLIAIPFYDKDNKEYYINKCINNANACQFIDMAPERDLFYFTPKKNKHRQRIEYNWDYFLTYPAESIYDDGIVLIGKGSGLPLCKFNNDSYKETYTPTGIALATFRSAITHNLVPGDTVQFKFSEGQKIPCKVVRIGDADGNHKKTYFSVRKSDIENKNIAKTNTIERFAKIVSGFECEYYFRKFKKINQNLRSTLNRLAFAKTIYGDEVSQIVFTDNVNISEYVDNLGRPLTEIYLTVLKTNRGHKDWYENNIANSENVEFSHVFGEITSGLDLPDYVGIDLPVVRRQHNINISQIKNSDIVIKESATKIEEDITKDYDSFYGDLVEFSPSDYKESVLEDVMHRFNTAQRETTNPEYTTLYYDEIGGDNYDGGRYGGNSVTGNTVIKQYELHNGYANLAPEGYIYKPHHKVQIGEVSDIVKQLSDTVLTISKTEDTSNDKKTITVYTEYDYNIISFDTIKLVDKKSNEVFKYLVRNSVKREESFEYFFIATLLGDNAPNKDITKENYYFFKYNTEIPDYAYMVLDGTGRYIWRDIVKPSSYLFTSPLYKTPFTNGAFYHSTNIIFPVKRQDPFYDYKSYISQDGLQLENNFEMPATKIDISGYEYTTENSSLPCF